MAPHFDTTEPRRSRWDQEDAEYIRSDSEWIHRCAAQLNKRLPGLAYASVESVALEVSWTDTTRARSPESVADELAGLDLPV